MIWMVSSGPAAERHGGDRTRVKVKYHQDRNPRVVSDDGTRERTAGRLLVARLRVEIAAREAAQPSDPRIGEARRELRALTGVDRDTD